MEMVTSAVAQFNVKVSNETSRNFPGCNIGVRIEEHGLSPTPTPILWTVTDEMTVPPIARRGSTTLDFGFQPLLEGLCVIKLSIVSVADENVRPTDVELRGYRAAGDHEISYYFRVLPREMIESS